MKLALDANCFINAVNPQAPSYGPVQKILAAQSSRQVELHVSLHTLHELEQKPDEALELARKLSPLPYWPIGKIEELVGTIKQMTGTFDDMRRNHAIQEELESLAKSGNDLRDRGAYLDALHASMDAFVTNDTHLVGTGPAKRIVDKFQMRILRPEEALELMTHQNS
jgi:predicted nucleic acid-binding protein